MNIEYRIRNRMDWRAFKNDPTNYRPAPKKGLPTYRWTDLYRELVDLLVEEWLWQTRNGSAEMTCVKVSKRRDGVKLQVQCLSKKGTPYVFWVNGSDVKSCFWNAWRMMKTGRIEWKVDQYPIKP